jgi:hypothetical protein
MDSRVPGSLEVKIEIGAIGVHDNATFTEAGAFCAKEVDGCE